MKKYNVTVNGEAFVVEVEELGGAVSVAAPAPVAPTPAPVAAPAPAAATRSGCCSRGSESRRSRWRFCYY